MSGLHRAMKRAEREGLLTWTHRDAEQPSRAAVLDKAADVPAPERLAPDTNDAPPVSYARVADGSLSPSFVAATEPGGFAAQQYRFLRTRLEGRGNVNGSHVWLVTSPCGGDGKTTTSANLALTMAREFQQRVVLVEADLRRPRLASLFGVPAGPGLVDLLMGACSLEETLVDVPESSPVPAAGGPGRRALDGALCLNDDAPGHGGVARALHAHRRGYAARRVGRHAGSDATRR